METWRQIFLAYPFLRVIWDGLSICIPLSALLAYTGIFFISAISKIIATSRNRPGFNKLARQLAFIGLVLGWLLLIGSRIWLYYMQPLLEPNSLYAFMNEISWLLLSIGVLIVSVYYSLWGLLKNMPVLLSTIGMIGAAQNTIALASILCAIRLGKLANAPGMATFALPDLFPNTFNDPLYSVACYTIPLFFGMAGAVSACWLIARRKKDDFGRDYYGQMLPFCCSWARLGWFLLWLMVLVSSSLQIWRNYQLHTLDMEEIIVDCSRLLFWLVPVLLWTPIIRSKVPMRLTLLAFAALVVCMLFMLPYYLELTLVS